MPRSFGRLKRRSEFLRVARARRTWAAPGLVLQAAPADTVAAARGAAATVRVGFTVRKKIGNAVVRNQATGSWNRHKMVLDKHVRKFRRLTRGMTVAWAP